MIINGSMVIDQRNSGAAVSSNSAYPVDRWVTSSSTSGAWTFQQLSPTSGTTSSPLPPAGFRSYIKFTKTTGATPAATGQPNYFLQHIEGFNSAQLSWGRSDAKPATLSFWVYSGATGTFGGSIRSTAVNYWSFPFSYTISTANTWEYKTIQITPITSGTWYTDNQVGVTIFFDLGSSADYKGTAGAWSNSNLVGATGTSQYPTTTSSGYMCWTGVQLEQNYQPTPFEQRPYGVELALCQRYYFTYPKLGSQVSDILMQHTADQTTWGRGVITHPVEMRAAPSLAVSPTAGNWRILGRAGSTPETIDSITIDTSNPAMTLLNTNKTGMSTNQTFFLRPGVNPMDVLRFQAEL